MKKELGRKVGVWCLAIGLFVVHMMFRTAAHADTGASSWKQVYAKGGECCISFPTIPQMVEQSLQLSESGQRLNYDIYLAPFENRGVFLLLVATYPMPLADGHEMAGLEGLLKGIIGHSPDNQLVFAKQIELKSHPAIDFLVQSGSSYFRAQALMVGNKLFLIAMEGRKGTMDEQTFLQFIRSFQLLD